MKTDAQRIAHYNARMLSTLVDPTLSAVNAMAVANFAAYATDFYPLQVHLRAILNTAGIATTKYAAFEAFNGEMYHLSKVADGASAVVMANALIDKYILFGCLEATLKTIALDVYNVIVP